jgi:hypothetical protein
VSQEFFASGFFHESVSPQPQSIPLGPFQIRGDIRKLRCTGINDSAPAANFATSFASVVDTGGKFATGGNLLPVSTTPAANLPPVSMTHVANNGNSLRLLRL